MIFFRIYSSHHHVNTLVSHSHNLNVDIFIFLIIHFTYSLSVAMKKAVGGGEKKVSLACFTIKIRKKGNFSHIQWEDEGKFPLFMFKRRKKGRKRKRNMLRVIRERRNKKRNWNCPCGNSTRCNVTYPKYKRC